MVLLLFVTGTFLSHRGSINQGLISVGEDLSSAVAPGANSPTHYVMTLFRRSINVKLLRLRTICHLYVRCQIRTSPGIPLLLSGGTANAVL